MFSNSYQLTTNSEYLPFGYVVVTNPFRYSTDIPLENSMKNYQQTPKQRRALLAKAKTSLNNSHKPTQHLTTKERTQLIDSKQHLAWGYGVGWL